MKHNLKITVILLSLFILTQIIGLYVVNYYSPTVVVNGIQQNATSPHKLPLGLEPSTETSQISVWQTLLYILPAFAIAILLFFFLTKTKSEIVIRIWFSAVVVTALFISISSFIPEVKYAWIAILAVSAVLAFFKVYRRNIPIHNITEVLIYPGIAAIFVALISSPENPNRGIYTMIALLILISLYDAWAVWRSGIMQKMAKYEINSLKIFGGFLIPSLSKRMKEKVKNLRVLKKAGKLKDKDKNRKIKVNIAILGGGDTVFPIITAGVVLRRFGFNSIAGIQVPLASIIVILGATLSLALLFIFSKKKPYPAMPFISAGIFAALGVCYLLLG